MPPDSLDFYKNRIVKFDNTGSYISEILLSSDTFLATYIMDYVKYSNNPFFSDFITYFENCYSVSVILIIYFYAAILKYKFEHKIFVSVSC